MSITVASPDAHFRFESDHLDSTDNDFETGVTFIGTDTYPDAKYGKGSLVENGINFIVFSSTSDLTIWLVGRAFTVGFWAVVDNLSEDYGIGGIVVDEYSADILCAQTTGVVAFNIDGTPISFGTVVAGVPFHLAFSFDPGVPEITTFLNGVKVETLEIADPGDLNTLLIGFAPEESVGFPGWIDDLRVYEGSATESRVASMMSDLYAASVDGSSPGMVRTGLGIGL